VIKEILYHWFGVTEPPCKSCEILQRQLDVVNYEKQQLLNSILAKPVEQEMKKEEYQPILQKKHIPWAVRRQMLEAEDREKAKLLKKLEDEVIGEEKKDAS
jgi:hypothetical protein